MSHASADILSMLKFGKWRKKENFKKARPTQPLKNNKVDRCYGTTVSIII